MYDTTTTAAVVDGYQITPTPQLPAHARAVYTVREAAALLSLSLSQTYALVRDGEIPARRLGSRWVIPKQAFIEWLNTCNTSTDIDPGW